jgi:hypothetical protein
MIKMQQIRIKDKIDAAVLGSREERVELLRAGFTGKEIEALYVVLNSFIILNMVFEVAYEHIPVIDSQDKGNKENELGQFNHVIGA